MSLYHLRIPSEQGPIMTFCGPRLMKLWGPPQMEPPSNSPVPVLNIFYLYILATFT
jgi:hypothetical protein